MHATLERQNAKLEELVSTDVLTGLKNRRHFSEVLEASLSAARRGGQPLSLVMLDVDRFKSFNDEFGHPAGDEVLWAVSEALRRGVRAGDTAARYGGEEFILLFPGTGAATSRAITERLRDAIAGRDWPLRRVTASFGIATTLDGNSTAAALIDRADKALYRSKQRGRDRVTHEDDPSPAIEDGAASLPTPPALAEPCEVC